MLSLMLVLIDKYLKWGRTNLANELFIMTGVRISESIEGAGLFRITKDKVNQAEYLVKDKSFKLINAPLVGNNGSLIIEATNLKTALRVFETVKLTMSILEHHQNEDMDLYRLKNDKDGARYKVYDLSHHSNFLGQNQLQNGIVLENTKFIKWKELIKLIFRDCRLRTALACFHQAQETYYTHLVGSYISSHSRVDLHLYETDEYKYLNMINFEKLCSSLTSAYRGVEAIMDCNFRERIFQNDHYKTVINGRIQGVNWNTKYLKAFDKVRYTDLNKKSYSKVSTMIKKLLSARNRAGHGMTYADQKKNNPITMELTHESKRFLEFLIIEYIDSKIDINELQ
jgi:hypothetical protein